MNSFPLDKLNKSFSHFFQCIGPSVVVLKQFLKSISHLHSHVDDIYLKGHTYLKFYVPAATDLLVSVKTVSDSSTAKCSATGVSVIGPRI